VTSLNITYVLTRQTCTDTDGAVHPVLLCWFKRKWMRAILVILLFLQ